MWSVPRFLFYTHSHRQSVAYACALARGCLCRHACSCMHALLSNLGRLRIYATPQYEGCPQALERACMVSLVLSLSVSARSTFFSLSCVLAFSRARSPSCSLFRELTRAHTCVRALSPSLSARVYTKSLALVHVLSLSFSFSTHARMFSHTHTDSHVDSVCVCVGVCSYVYSHLYRMAKTHGVTSFEGLFSQMFYTGFSCEHNP